MKYINKYIDKIFKGKNNNAFNSLKTKIKNNPLFFVFVITLIANSLLLRFLTINSITNTFNLKPFLMDTFIILLIASFGYLFKSKVKFNYYFIVSIIITIIFVINSTYYRFYTSFASISLLSTSKYASDVSDAIFKTVLKPKDLIYVYAPILLLIIHLKLKKTTFYNFNENIKYIKSKIKRIVIAAFLCLATALLLFNKNDYYRFTKHWNKEYVVMQFGILTYQINDIFKSLEPQINNLLGYDNAIKLFREYYKDKEKNKPIKNEYTNIFEGKNIISIHLESMQTFAMDLKFNGREVTPNLNKLRKQSLYFNNFYSQVSVGTSSDSEFTLNTSLMPTSNGTAFANYHNREYVTIPKLLKDKGYYTFSMHGNVSSFWNRDVMYKTIGYDDFYSKLNYNIDDVVGLGLSDKSFFKQSIEKIKDINKKGKPFYGTVIMLSNHTPFDSVDKYGVFNVDIKENIRDENNRLKTISYPYMENTTMGNYFKSYHYADEALGQFINDLETSGLMDNTVVIMYGDHDARLALNDFVRLYNYDKKTDSIKNENDPTYKKIDYYAYELLRKVPFMIYSKETKERLHKEISTPMGMYNIMPTLGNMFNFYNPYQLGKDIFSIDDDNLVLFPNGNWLTSKIYYNSQKSSYFTIQKTEIEESYIKNKLEEAEKILNVSNSLIFYDLIRRESENSK